MFNVTRPQSTLFLIIIAVMALLLLMLPSLSAAGPDGKDHEHLVGKNIQWSRINGQKQPGTPAEITPQDDGQPAGIQPRATDWYARIERTTVPGTPPADIFFDLDREVTVESDMLKSSAGVRINW